MAVGNFKCWHLGSGGSVSSKFGIEELEVGFVPDQLPQKKEKRSYSSNKK